MDLEIRGRRALITGGSKGLGRAAALALAREGARVTIVARGADDLQRTADTIAERAGTATVVQMVVADITSPAGRAAALAACPAPDILVLSGGGPGPADFRDLSVDDWSRALNAVMLSPIEMIRATVDGMIERRFGRIVTVSSNSVKAPIPGMCLSNSARTGLAGFIAGLARQTVRHNVTINSLLPGFFDTDRQKTTLPGMARQRGVTVEEMRALRLAEVPAGRTGDPAEFGEACAFLCGASSGYITGQNLLIDGGLYPGTF
jgi:3-oxoacyl-[acyl-carrier protein] reductase